MENSRSGGCVPVIVLGLLVLLAAMVLVGGASIGVIAESGGSCNVTNTCFSEGADDAMRAIGLEPYASREEWWAERPNWLR